MYGQLNNRLLALARTQSQEERFELLNDGVPSTLTQEAINGLMTYPAVAVNSLVFGLGINSIPDLLVKNDNQALNTIKNSIEILKSSETGSSENFHLALPQANEIGISNKALALGEKLKSLELSEIKLLSQKPNFGDDIGIDFFLNSLTILERKAFCFFYNLNNLVGDDFTTFFHNAIQNHKMDQNTDAVFLIKNIATVCGGAFLYEMPDIFGILDVSTSYNTATSLIHQIELQFKSYLDILKMSEEIKMVSVSPIITIEPTLSISSWVAPISDEFANAVSFASNCLANTNATLKGYTVEIVNKVLSIYKEARVLFIIGSGVTLTTTIFYLTSKASSLKVVNYIPSPTVASPIVTDSLNIDLDAKKILEELKDCAKKIVELLKDLIKITFNA